MFTTLLGQSPTVPTWLPLWMQEWLPLIGATMFGAVIGWLTGHVLRAAEQPNVRWLGAVIAVIGGGGVTALFDYRSYLFGAYCIGLGVAFFAHVAFTKRPPSAKT